MFGCFFTSGFGDSEGIFGFSGGYSQGSRRCRIYFSGGVGFLFGGRNKSPTPAPGRPAARKINPTPAPGRPARERKIPHRLLAAGLARNEAVEDFYLAKNPLWGIFRGNP